jgi:hypothetical protein
MAARFYSACPLFLATVERETSAASDRPDDPRRALNDLFKK